MNESSNSGLDLKSLENIRLAVLQSERLRTACLMAVLGFIALIGLYRVVYPLENAPTSGALIFIFTSVFIFFEFYLFKALGSSNCRNDNRLDKLRFIQLIMECMFPLGIMFLIIQTSSINPYMILASPGYALILIILAASVLRLDMKSTFLSGLVSTLGYAALVLYVMYHAGTEFDNPFTDMMYFNLIIMVLLASGLAMFITQKMRQYLDVAVEELNTHREHELLQRDLDMAREIQQSLLPESIFQIHEYELAGFSSPAQKAGGDYYDWRLIDDTRLILSIADVTGHGIGPALVTATCRAYVRAILEGQEGPEKLVSRVNTLLHEDMPAGKFVTFGLMDLNLEQHIVKFVSAGHAPHLLIKGDTGKVDYIQAQGMPLGIVGQQDLDEAVIHNLEHGDILAMFSDGIYEVANQSGEQFGLERFVNNLVSNRQLKSSEILEAMRDILDDFVGDGLQQDDITLVILKRS